MSDWPPNLDCMDADDLAAFLKNATLLIDYAKIKIEAMQARERGFIPVALKLEHDCDQIFNQLPEELRW